MTPLLWTKSSGAWRRFLGAAAATCLGLGILLSQPAAASGDEAEAVVGPVVDLNQAGIDELCTLPGIGRKKAEAIMALRDRRPLTRITQLLQVKGIGQKTLQKLKPRVVINLDRDPAKPPSQGLSTRR
jgi:competence ComEA-like helix-hairpin-helix protein